jgi:ElaB/YqjD/DUF883 family membrane-anchored ribosome-binding protein
MSSEASTFQQSAQTGQDESSWTAKAQEMVDETKEMATSVKDAAGDLVNRYGSKIEEVASDAAEQITSIARSAGHWTARETTELVKRNPVTALLVAFGVGFLLAHGTRR